MEDKKVLGERLKGLRGSRTQEEVAKILGLSRARYSHYENNRVEPDTALLNKMADFFNVSIDYLLGRTDNPGSPEQDEEDFQKFISDPDLKRWHRELPKSSEEDLRKLRKMWEIMKDDKDK